jgi:hypothetical protein
MVTVDWQVGPVTVRPVENLVQEVTGRSPATWHPEAFTRQLADYRTGAMASVEAPDFETGLGQIVQVVRLLRVFQHVIHGVDSLSQFEIAGEIGKGVLPYMVQSSDGGFEYGLKSRGDPIGWTFKDRSAWENNEAFRWMADGIGRPASSDGQGRALVGVEFLAQALVERRPPFKLVALVTALEAWLLPRRKTSQTFKLARAVSYFACERGEGVPCRDWPNNCLYIGLRPDNDKDLGVLKAKEECPKSLAVYALAHDS